VLRIERSELDYQAYYCEENVWRLLARPEFANMACWAVLVSNERRDVVTLRQRSGRSGDGLVHWDYHVFAVATDPIEGRVALDLDSELSFPSPLRRYLEDSFPSDVQRAYLPLFRVIAGDEYVGSLVSDRSHMRRLDGSWIAPPPPWPAPGAGKANLLVEWTDMRRRKPGTLYDMAHMSTFAMG
jgi:protein N-terminal glutamine amidohydrolase